MSIPEKTPSLAIVIPAHNEERRIGEVLRSLPRHLVGIGSIRVFVVDDGSKDQTAAIARSEGATVLRHIVNLGAGGAMLTGCDAAFKSGADIILTMDADGQHAPSDIQPVLEPLLHGGMDVSFGARTIAKPMPTLMRVGNWGLNTSIRLLYRVSMRDSQSGFRAFRREVYPHLRWGSRDYAVCTEMVIRTVRQKLRWAEIPIATIYHDQHKGTQPLDGVRILRQLLWWRIVGNQ